MAGPSIRVVDRRATVALWCDTARRRNQLSRNDELARSLPLPRLRGCPAPEHDLAIHFTRFYTSTIFAFLSRTHNFPRCNSTWFDILIRLTMCQLKWKKCCSIFSTKWKKSQCILIFSFLFLERTWKYKKKCPLYSDQEYVWNFIKLTCCM